MTDQPAPLDRRTLLAVFDACRVGFEHPDDSADVRIDGAMWRRLKRMATQRGAQR